MAQAAPGSNDASPRLAFYKDSRGYLALARARGDTLVTIAIASLPGRGNDVATRITRLGGIVDVRQDAIGYLRVRVPLDSAERVAGLQSIQAADVSVTLTPWRQSRSWLPPYSSVDPAEAAVRTPIRVEVPVLGLSDTNWPPRPSRYPFDHPYSPLKDLDAAEWRAAHPTWDGRGVTIADVEWTPDLLAPELQVGLTSDGRETAKFVDVITSVRPSDWVDSSSTLWLTDWERVVARGGRLSYRGREYVAPHDGTFEAAMVNERSFIRGSIFQVDEDLNRDGNPPNADSLFAVIWDVKRNTVWVDTDQDRSFTDERPLMDYHVRHDVGVFGHDNPATPIRESVAFAVQIDSKERAVALSIGLGGHASMVAGAAAGSRLGGGHYDGVAPGARLISINYGAGSAASFTEALILAFTDPRVDVVLLEQNVFVADVPYRLRDGRFVASVIASRLVARFGKPLLVPAGNTVGVGMVGELATVRNVIGVGAFQSRESYLTNRGVVVASSDNLHPIGSGGPAGDGAMKPDILAPSDILSSWLGFQAGHGVPPLYDLPPGYVIAAGTSTAAAVAAGSVALLISAAKQTGLPYDEPRIRTALLESGRYLDGIPVLEQGNGLLQIERAWGQVVHMASYATGTATLDIRVEGPVRTALSAWLPSPNMGPALYEVDGWSVGRPQQRALTLTRTSGPATPLTLDVHWLGNDGTYSSNDQLVLPLNRAVELSLTVRPRESGAHTALLELFDSRPGAPPFRIPCTVIVPDTFSAPAFTVTWRDSLPRPGRKSFFVRVPPAASALRWDISRVPTGAIVTLHRPDGRDAGYLTDTTDSEIWLPSPEPGVWQASLRGDWTVFQASQTPGSAIGPLPITLSVAVLGMSVQAAAPDTTGAPWQVEARNRFAPAVAQLMGSPIASGYARVDTLGPAGQRTYSIEVPPGSTWLLARANPRGATVRDLDLYAFDCTGRRCVPAAANADTAIAPAIAVPSPAAGKWKVVVDAPRETGSGVTFEYLDLVVNPCYGASEVADARSDRPSPAQWRAPGNVWQAVPVAAPRRPFAVFRIGAARQARESAAPTVREPIQLDWTAIPIEQ